MANPPTWTTVQHQLQELPHWNQACFAVRAARRVWPIIASCEPQYGSEAVEWLGTIDACLRTVEQCAQRKPVTRFTLDLAAELARATAIAGANAARVKGISDEIHQAELAYAAAAFAADCARTADPKRATTLAVQAAQSACAGDAITLLQLEDLHALQQGEPLAKLWESPRPELVDVAYSRLKEFRSVLLLPPV